MPGRQVMGVALVTNRDSAIAPLTLNGRVYRAPELPMALPPSAVAIGVYFDPARNAMDLIVADESFDEVPDGEIPPELIGMLSFPRPIAIAVQTIEHAIAEDDDYRRAWHANFACAAMDEGIDHETAQKIATRCVAVVSPRAGTENDERTDG